MCRAAVPSLAPGAEGISLGWGCQDCSSREWGTGQENRAVLAGAVEHKAPEHTSCSPAGSCRVRAEG